MENVVTERDYPITTLWIFKAPIIFIAISVVAIFFNYWFPYLIILIPFYLIANPLIKKNFHFSTDEKFLVVDQGVFTKKHFNLPYGVIQNIIIKQDWFDRVFGLATLTVENAVQGGNKAKQIAAARAYKGRQGDSLGSSGNKVNLVGLKKSDAEALKLVILQRMKENPIDDNNSGL